MPKLFTSTHGSTQEHLLVLACVAFVGMVAFGHFGVAELTAIAGHSASHAPVVPNFSPQAGAAGDFARAAKDLYREVPLKVERSTGRDYPQMGRVLQALDEQQLDVTQFGELIRTPNEAPLLYDLYREFLALRDQGTFEAGVYQGAQGTATNRVLEALVITVFFGSGEYHVGTSLAAARYHFTETGTAIPEAFLERIRTTAQIYGRGIDEATRERVFGPPGKGGGGTARRIAARSATVADDSGELATVLGRFEGPRSVPRAFASKYLDDPWSALALVPDAGRKYLESEVLPILRAQGDERGAQLIRGESEADLVTSIVMGDTGGVESALAKAQENASGALPDEFEEVARYAARTFEPFWDSLGKLERFDEEEATSLVRFPNPDLEALRARPEGGDLIASALESLDDVDLVPLPGRPAAHRNIVLEGLIRSVARGLPDEYDRFLGHAAEMFEELPESMTTHFEQLLERFKGGTS